MAQTLGVACPDSVNYIYILKTPLHSSISKESACNAGDPGSVPELGRSAGEGIGYWLQYSWASLVAQQVKNPPAMRVDLGSIPGLGRYPREGKSYPLQGVEIIFSRYFGLEKSMDSPWTVHGVTKSWTWLSNFQFNQFNVSNVLLI